MIVKCSYNLRCLAGQGYGQSLAEQFKDFKGEEIEFPKNINAFSWSFIHGFVETVSRYVDLNKVKIKTSNEHNTSKFYEDINILLGKS